MNLFLSWTRCSPNHTMVLLLNLNRSCLSLMKADAYTQLLIILKHAQIKVDAMLRFHFFLYLWFTFLTILPLVVFWFLWWGYVICLALLERFSSINFPSVNQLLCSATSDSAILLELLLVVSFTSYWWSFCLVLPVQPPGDEYSAPPEACQVPPRTEAPSPLETHTPLLFLLQTPLVAKVELVISPHHFFSIYL